MTFHLYKINELYSNADGAVQFIEMTVGNFDDEGFWAGHAISVTQGGTTHSFTFPTNLPNETTANTTVLIATQAFANLGIVHPDFIIPAGFLFTNGGTVDYAGVDTFSYALLPTDGSTALYSTGSTAPAVATDFAGASASVNLISVAEALANPNGPPVAIVDNAGNVASSLDGLQVMTAHGKLTSIALDAPNPVVISAAQLSSDAATLALVAGPYNLGVVVAGGSFSYSLAGNVAGLIVSGESSASIVGNASFNTITLGSGNDSVTAGGGGSYIVTNGGNDQLFGGAGGLAGGLGNTIYAFGGNDYLQGGAGSPSDVLVATGSGNDTFYGGSGNNYIVGGTGKNTIVGGGGALQSLYGAGSGGDYIVGGSSVTASNVLAEDGTGPAQLWGGPGNNYEVGGPRDDLVVGGNSDDYLFGGNGDDTIYGGNGSDQIFPGLGNDFIWTDNVGSQSTDNIYEGVGTGVDTVADFTPGDGANHDVLVLTAASSEIASFSDVQAKAFQAGVYTVLPLSNTDQIYLYNVQPFQLTANDFIFT